MSLVVLSKNMDDATSAALDSFIARAAAAGVEGSLSPVPEIVTFEQRFPGLLPEWYREVLATARIGDICFETEVEGVPSWVDRDHVDQRNLFTVRIDEFDQVSRFRQHFGADRAFPATTVA